MLIRPNRFHERSCFRRDTRGTLIITRRIVIATGIFARVYS